jgi:hypothetical protein|nr:MAG TPA: hypothetical protein [Caudoviricetes sp.]
MKYKVIAYHSDIQEEVVGTCDFCMGTEDVENGYITVEDETEKTTSINLTYRWWSYNDTIYIDNVVNFSAWLQEREVKEIRKGAEFEWLNSLVMDYKEEQEERELEDE